MRQVFRAGELGGPRGMGWGVRWEGGSGWGTHVNPWLIHVNVWQKPPQYCEVISLQLRKKKIIMSRTESFLIPSLYLPNSPIINIYISVLLLLQPMSQRFCYYY